MTSPPQGLSVQLHIPYSEHAKVPVGPLAMGLAPALDPKKLGEARGLATRRGAPGWQPSLAGPGDSAAGGLGWGSGAAL